MYGIIQWKNQDNEIYPVLNPNGTMKVFDKLYEADHEANNYIESESYRVVNLESIHE